MTGAQNLGFFAVIQFEATIEDVQRPLPQARVLVFFGVANDSTVNLVDLFKPAVFHHERKNFTANSACAVSNNWLVLEMVISTAFKHLDKFGGCFNWRNNGIFELADCGLVFIATIKENHFITTCRYEIIDFGRREVDASADNAIFINDYFFGDSKGHDLVARSYLQTWKLISVSFGPFVLHVLEGSEILHDPDVSLDLVERSTHRAVDTVFRNQYPSTKGICLTQSALPQADRFWISKWSEFVKEDDLLRPDNSEFIGISNGSLPDLMNLQP